MAEGSWLDWPRRNWKIALPVGIVVVAVGAWLVFGFFGFQTLFIDETVEEAAPVFESGAGASGMPSDEITEEQADAMNDAMEDVPAEEPVTETTTMPEATVTVERTGSFIDRSHPTSGQVTVVTDGSQRFLRLEDFATDNGPDLNVYLSTALPDAPAGDFAVDFVDLGDLKGNIGDQNYEIPIDAELDEYRSVVIWCVRFGVAFGAAELVS